MVHLAHFLMLTVGSSKVLSLCVRKIKMQQTPTALLPLYNEDTMALQLRIVMYEVLL